MVADFVWAAFFLTLIFLGVDSNRMFLQTVDIKQVVCI